MRAPRPFSLVASALLAAACASPSSAPPALGTCHPACPGADATALAPPSEVLRVDGEPRAPAAPVEARAPSTAAYVCPMHLHVGSAEPGRCPECNMRLVERASLEHDHDG